MCDIYRQNFYTAYAKCSEYLACKTAAEKPGIGICVLEPSLRKNSSMKKAFTQIHQEVAVP